MTALRELIEAVEAGRQLALDDTAKAWDATHPYAYSTLAPLTLKAAAGSLDAARALHEAVLPGWVLHRLGQRHGGIWEAHLLETSEGGWHRAETDRFVKPWNDDPARAWLLGVLQAMEKQS